MSTSELLDQLAKLERSERENVWQRLEEIELTEIDQTPEMLASIGAGRTSVREGKTHTLEEPRKLLAKWTVKF